MTLVRWDPVRDLASMEIDRLNNMFTNFIGGEGFTRNWMPPVDIYETDNHEVVIKAELPEMKREDISVTFENNILTLRGERKFETEVPRDGYQRFERFYGSFSRSFTLPSTVDTENVNAEYDNGVLNIRLDKRAEAKPKQIKVNIGAGQKTIEAGKGKAA